MGYYEGILGKTLPNGLYFWYAVFTCRLPPIGPAAGFSPPGELTLLEYGPNGVVIFHGAHRKEPDSSWQLNSM